MFNRGGGVTYCDSLVIATIVDENGFSLKISFYQCKYVTLLGYSFEL